MLKASYQEGVECVFSAPCVSVCHVLYFFGVGTPFFVGSHGPSDSTWYLVHDFADAALTGVFQCV